jgi:hypothetical protein
MHHLVPKTMHRVAPAPGIARGCSGSGLRDEDARGCDVLGHPLELGFGLA